MAGYECFSRHSGMASSPQRERESGGSSQQGCDVNIVTRAKWNVAGSMHHNHRVTAETTPRRVTGQNSGNWSHERTCSREALAPGTASPSRLWLFTWTLGHSALRNIGALLLCRVACFSKASNIAGMCSHCEELTAHHGVYSQPGASLRASSCQHSLLHLPYHRKCHLQRRCDRRTQS